MQAHRWKSFGRTDTDRCVCTLADSRSRNSAGLSERARDPERRTRRGIRISYGTKERLASRGLPRAANFARLARPRRNNPTCRPEIIRRWLPNPRERSERPPKCTIARKIPALKHTSDACRSIVLQWERNGVEKICCRWLTDASPQARRRDSARDRIHVRRLFQCAMKTRTTRHDRGPGEIDDTKTFRVLSKAIEIIVPCFRVTDNKCGFLPRRAHSHCNFTQMSQVFGRSESRDTPVTIELAHSTRRNVRSRAPVKNGCRYRRREATASPERAVPCWSRFRGLLPLPRLPRVGTKHIQDARVPAAARVLSRVRFPFRYTPTPTPTSHLLPDRTPRKRARTGPRIPCRPLFVPVVYLSLSGLRTAHNRLPFSTASFFPRSSDDESIVCILGDAPKLADPFETLRKHTRRRHEVRTLFRKRSFSSQIYRTNHSLGKNRGVFRRNGHLHVTISPSSVHHESSEIRSANFTPTRKRQLTPRTGAGSFPNIVEQ